MGSSYEAIWWIGHELFFCLPYFPDLVHSYYFLLQNLKICLGRKDKFQRWNHRSNQCLFWRLRQLFWLRRIQKIWVTLGEVFEVHEGLRWANKLFSIKKTVFHSNCYCVNISYLLNLNNPMFWLVSKVSMHSQIFRGPKKRGGTGSDGTATLFNWSDLEKLCREIRNEVDI